MCVCVCVYLYEGLCVHAASGLLYSIALLQVLLQSQRVDGEEWHVGLVEERHMIKHNYTSRDHRWIYL